MNKIQEAADNQAVGPVVEAEPAAPQLGRRLANPRTLASFGLAIILLVLAVRGLHINPSAVWTTMRHADLKFFVLAFIVYYASFPARGMRWRLLMGNAYEGAERTRILHYPLFDLTEILYLSWFANCIVPAKLGDFYRAYLARNCLRVSMSKNYGTILAERMLDLLVLFPLLMIATVWAFWSRLDQLPQALRLALLGGLILALLAVAVLVILWRFDRFISRLLPKRIADVFAQLRNGVMFSLRGNIMVPLGLTVFAWLMEGGRLYFVLWSLHLIKAGELGLSAAIFLALGSSVLTTLPLTAGGLGVVESFLTVTLTFFLLHPTNGGYAGMTKDAVTNLAASAALLDRLISYVSLVVIGLVVYIFSKKTRMIAMPPLPVEAQAP